MELRQEIADGAPGPARQPAGQSAAGNEAKKAGEGVVKDALSTQAAATTGSEIRSEIPRAGVDTAQGSDDTV